MTDDIGFGTCAHGKPFVGPGDPVAYGCGDCLKKLWGVPTGTTKVERYLWVFKRNDGVYYNHSEYYSIDQAEHIAEVNGWKLIGRDPNCKEPLVTEE